MVAIPFGAAGARTVETDMLVIARHYRLRPAAIQSDDAAIAVKNSDVALQARDALFWKLANERGFSFEAVAKLAETDAETARVGVAAHEARITNFRDNKRR